MEGESLFYKYYIEKEKLRRNEAIKLFNSQDYSKLCKNYIHYLKKEIKSIKIENYGIDKVIEQLTKIKTELPKNTTSVFLNSYSIDDEDCIFPSYETIIDVSYIEYSIKDESHCLALAKCWARDDSFKMKVQSNGIDGKKATELYNKLIKE